MRTPRVLTPDDLDAFRREGWVRVEEAFPRERALAMQDVLWEELAADHGIERDDRATWRVPPHGMRRAKEHPLNEELATDRFLGAISDLLGREDWPRPRGWGGFLLTFPADPGGPRVVPTDTWHWDGPPGGDGLLVFSFFSSVAPGGGGTQILSGSPRLIAAFYASLDPDERAAPHRVHRRMFRSWDPWLAALTGASDAPVADRVAAFLGRPSVVRGVPCRVVELTGEPGDAVYCDPGMLHAAAPNRSEVPRFMRVKFLMMQ